LRAGDRFLIRLEPVGELHFWELIDEDRRVAKAKIRVTVFGSCVCE
jgi:hypothetical protein